MAGHGHPNAAVVLQAHDDVADAERAFLAEDEAVVAALGVLTVVGGLVARETLPVGLLLDLEGALAASEPYPRPVVPERAVQARALEPEAGQIRRCLCGVVVHDLLLR